MRRVSFMTAHKIFKRYIKRLRRLRHKYISQNLSKLTSKTDLNKTFDYLDISKVQIKIISSLRMKAEKLFSFMFELMKKFYTPLIYFFKEKNGRYRLYLEKKDKLDDDSKKILLNLNNLKKKEKQNINIAIELALNSPEEEGYKNNQDNLNDNNENKQLIFSTIKNSDDVLQESENDGIKIDTKMVMSMKNSNLSLSLIPSRYAKASQDRPLVFWLKRDTQELLSTKGALKQSSPSKQCHASEGWHPGK